MCPGMCIGADSLILGNDCACVVVSIRSKADCRSAIGVCPRFIGGDFGMLFLASGGCACAGANIVAGCSVACSGVSSSWCC